jgi:hypothetical protein
MKRLLHLASRSVVLALAALSFAAGACQSSNSATDSAGQPAAARADADRAALARLVGVWTFEGWATDPDGSRRQSAGRAAGAIENNYFVLLDIQSSTGRAAGPTPSKSGSILFASDPGLGLTASAWGDGSPAVRRLAGQVSGNGTVFTFDEAVAPYGLRRANLTITFLSPDRWTAEVRDHSAAGHPVVASYTFTRS